MICLLCSQWRWIKIDFLVKSIQRCIKTIPSSRILPWSSWFPCSKFRRLSMKLKIPKTMASKTLLIYMIDRMLGTNKFFGLRNEASFKWLLISIKQVNNELGVYVLSLFLINFSRNCFIAVKNIFHKFVP